MRKVYAVMVIWALAATAAQAQITPGPRRVRPPAAERVLLQGADDRIVVPFSLSRENPTFTYRFSPPAAGTYTAAAQWETARPVVVRRLPASEMKLTVTVGPTGQQSTSSGRSPLGVVFEAQGGAECAILIAPARAPMDAKGELAVLLGEGEGARKRIAPPGQGFAAAVAARTRKDALVPVFVRLAERHLAGAPDKNDLDRAFERALARHPRVTRELLARFVDDYHALPAALKERAFETTATQGAPTAPVTMAALQAAMSVQGAPATAPPTGGPHIRRIETHAAEQGYPAGGRVTISGSGFAPTPSQNRIEYHRTIPAAGEVVVGPYSDAIRGSTESLEFRIPPGMHSGTYHMRVRIRGTTDPALTSNYVPIPIYQTEEPTSASAPVIASISPANQEPSQEVEITGRRFQVGKRYWVRMQPEQAGEEVQGTSEPAQATVMRFRIPERVMPGKYAISVRTSGAPESEAKEYTVKAPRYRVLFTKMKCIDESNPEWWGDDEVVTFWVTVANDVGWAKNSGQYGGFHDGKEREYREDDRRVFPVEERKYWGEVGSGLIIATRLYEWDYGDVQAAQDFLGVMSEVANAALSAPLGLSQGGGPAYDFWVSIINEIASWFGGDPDNLGTVEKAWTYAMLQQMLEPGASIVGALHFLNSDGKGSYSLEYAIERE